MLLYSSWVIKIREVFLSTTISVEGRTMVLILEIGNYFLEIIFSQRGKDLLLVLSTHYDVTKSNLWYFISFYIELISKFFSYILALKYNDPFLSLWSDLTAIQCDLRDKKLIKYEYIFQSGRALLQFLLFLYIFLLFLHNLLFLGALFFRIIITMWFVFFIILFFSVNIISFQSLRSTILERNFPVFCFFEFT